MRTAPAVGFAAPQVSLVVPLRDESAAIDELYRRINATMAAVGRSYELVFVDDGSSDGTFERLLSLRGEDDAVKIVRLKGSFGQTAALSAGFDYARGELVISFDGDLQHAPEEIPTFLRKLDEGFDVVSGWRTARRDSLLLRRAPSAIANWLMRRLSGIPLHDFGTTYKAYRRETLEQVKLYGDFHRFIPVFVRQSGGRIAEIPIAWRERPHGRSHYGLARTWTVLFDIIRIKLLTDYFSKPFMLFGSFGFLTEFAGLGLACWLVWLKYAHGISLMQSYGPMLLLSILLIIMGAQFLTLGILGEMIVKAYYDRSPRRIYGVRETAGFDGRPPR